MPHRVTDPNKIRHAHHYNVDAAVDASVTAYTAIVRGEYRGGGDYRRAERKPAENKPTQSAAVERHPAQIVHQDEAWNYMHPDVVHERLERSRVAPHALTIACQHAEIGEFCYPSCGGICGERVRHAVIGKAMAP